jgi:hypothetical protein
MWPKATKELLHPEAEEEFGEYTKDLMTEIHFPQTQ